MEELKYPITIKKKNWFMLSVGIAEIVFGLVWIIPEGIKSLAMWIFIVTGIITSFQYGLNIAEILRLEKRKLNFIKIKN